MSSWPATGTNSGGTKIADAGLEAEIRAGLDGPGPKRLSPRWLYDDLGSALFEAITLLPEYELSRADERILRAHAHDITRLVPAPGLVAELGSGSGRKTRWLLEALAARQPVRYFPIDISPAALARCRIELGRLPAVRFEPIAAEFLEGLCEAAARRRGAQPLLLLFLGSTIGNFERPADEHFLRAVRRYLRAGDALLLGTDLVKAVPRLLAAYDDALGVTAAFDLNLLARLNRELDADFDLGGFEHQARWNENERRIEMHLVARRAQAVMLRALGLRVSFRAGESLWSESSYKYAPEEPAQLAARAGFQPAAQWQDQDWPFAESLLIAH
jgi:dimethylhistidine N-methyltransferase